MSDPLRLAVVGCGDVAGFTAGFARLNRGIRLAACCDRDAGQAERFARRHAIPRWYPEVDELLAAGDFDALYLAVPHDLHLPMARAGLEHGLAVLLEKPLAATLAEGIELARLAALPNARLAVNYQYRYDAGCYALAAAARQGALGKIRYARCNIPWRRELDYFTRSAGWHASAARAGGGTLLTQGSHFLDVLLWACASRPVRAQGLTRRMVFHEIEVEDLAMGTVELESGALLQVCSSMVANPEQPATVEVYGELGSAFYRSGLLPRLEFRGVKLRREGPPGRGIHALARSLEAFRLYAQGGVPHLASAAESLITLAAVDALYRAAGSGQWEDVFI
jgi:UDP-N-acetyl-2-amino-2-deoxyglucuronate dehydrogenase